MHIKKERWGTFKSREVYLYTLTNSLGGVVQLTNYGARIVRIRVPDKAGVLGEVALGFDTLIPYLEDENYIGATLGRFANRISNSRFDLAGETWELEANEGLHCNHSASAGFDHRIFDVNEGREHTGASGELVFQLFDAHGRGGFPGDLNLSIVYVWGELANQLSITYRATTDRPGILNLTNHCYFNLSSDNAVSNGFQNCLTHQLEISSGSQLEMDGQYIPTGKRLPVKEGAVSGFIGDLCPQPDWENKTGLNEIRGLNTCYELNAAASAVACRLLCNSSGRHLEIATSYPGLVVYTGDDLHSYEPGFFQRPYRPFDGVALECQYYPDNPNLPGFQQAFIGPNKPYHEFITYTFTTEPLD